MENKKLQLASEIWRTIGYGHIWRGIIYLYFLGYVHEWKDYHTLSLPDADTLEQAISSCEETLSTIIAWKNSK